MLTDYKCQYYEVSRIVNLTSLYFQFELEFCVILSFCIICDFFKKKNKKFLFFIQFLIIFTKIICF